MPIPAAVIADLKMTARITAIHMSAQDRRPTVAKQPQRLTLIARQTKLLYIHYAQYLRNTAARILSLTWHAMRIAQTAYPRG